MNRTDTHIYQLHEFIKHIYLCGGSHGVVLYGVVDKKTVSMYPDDIPLYVVARPDAQTTPKLSRKLLHHIAEKDLTREFIANKLLVAQISTVKIPSLVKRLAPKAFCSVVISPLPKLQLRKVTAPLHGRVYTSNQTWRVTIDGAISNPYQRANSSSKVLAIVPQYNERDIIPTTIRHLLEQGVDVHVIDNWSDDGSYEYVSELARENPTRISVERFPAQGKSTKYEWTRILERVEDKAFEQSKQYDWIMLNDADEVRWSPWPKVTLQQAFAFVTACGYNAVDYTVFNLKPTKEGFNEDSDARSFFTHGELGTLPGYFVQIKSWSHKGRVKLAASGGHHVAFDHQLIFPYKFILAHYPLRSTAHAKRKIFKERLPRYLKTEVKGKGWHTHYNSASNESSFTVSTDSLIKFDQKDFYEDHLIERLSGAGIDREVE